MRKFVFFVIVFIVGSYFQNIAFSADLPSSRRSEDAIAKVKPVLEQELKDKGLNFGSPIYIRIFKETGELELWVKNSERFELFKTYEICFYSGGLGPKLMSGDQQSPEGFYFVKATQLNPNSQFHLSFNIGYPNAYDRVHGRTGSALMVHGNCVSIGCYAMTNKKIEEIYAMADAALRNEQPFFRVHIFPFRMTEINMNIHKQSEWFNFWENLKEGYDIFEAQKIPPNVLVKNKKYVFEKI
ncbi:MAG: murein L,D-transpeptidase family protein [Thermodesulfobacteriota bacterium]